MFSILDQHPRYRNIQKIVNSAWKRNRIFRVCPMGTDEHIGFTCFLSDAKITYLEYEAFRKDRKKFSLCLGGM